MVLTHVRIEGHAELLPRLKVYALLAPHLDGGGAGNSARAVDIAGRKVLMAWKDQWSLAMAASLRVLAGELRVCGRERRLARPDGQLHDGLGVWLGDQRQHRSDGRDWTCGAASCGENGSAYEFTVAFGIGEGIIRRRRRRWASLATPFAEHRGAVYYAVAAGGEPGVAGGQGSAMAAS